MTKNEEHSSKWTFLSNHSHVLVVLSREPLQSLREVATKVGLTERAVQKIVQDLDEGGYLTREKQGRRNRYRMALSKKLRHSVESQCTVRDLIELLK